MRQKCVVDGNKVNIPLPILGAKGGRIIKDCPGVGSPGIYIVEGY